ncbi:MAG: hypothetical protein LBS51_07190 [Oscillospiraceae bacterium]|nr:hypothetical protein [Oscillospiraceae bacterium]
MRHARRAAAKSALALLLAALLMGAVGQFAMMKQSYADLCENTVIKANFVGGVQLAAMLSPVVNGYAVNPYYEIERMLGINFSAKSIVITNDIARYTGEKPEIEYADGYDASCMGKLGTVFVVGKELLAQYGLALGDTVEAYLPVEYLNAIRDYIEGIRTSHPEYTYSDGEMLKIFSDGVLKTTGVRTVTFTVAGAVSTPSGRYDTAVFAPGTNDISGILNSSTTTVAVAELTLADYRLADELRDFGENMARWSVLNEVDFIMDTSKLESPIKTLELLTALYPIAAAAALLIGGFLCALVIFQSSKDAAIMRVQGTTKRKTRAILAIEQIFLGVAGLALGACALLAYNGSGLTAIAGDLTLFVGLYFAVVAIAATFSSAAATHKNVLELLQTKE